MLQRSHSKLQNPKGERESEFPWLQKLPKLKVSIQRITHKGDTESLKRTAGLSATLTVSLKEMKTNAPLQTGNWKAHKAPTKNSTYSRKKSPFEQKVTGEPFESSLSFLASHLSRT